MLNASLFKKSAVSLTFFILFMIVAPQFVRAQTQLITNPGFETGTFAGWTAVNAPSPFEAWAVTGSGSGYVDSPVPVATQVVEGTRNANQTVASNIGSFLLYQDVATPTTNTLTLYWRHKYQMNLTTYCTGAACGTATFAVEILNTSNVLLQTLYTITTVGSSNTNTGWTLNTANLTGYAGQTIRIRFRTTVSANYAGPGRLEVDDVRLAARPLTSAEVHLSGKVTTAKGEGIARAAVTITDANGNTAGNAMTGAFGSFEIGGLEAGQTYTVSIGHKKYQFNPQIMTLNENVSDARFVAIE